MKKSENNYVTSMEFTNALNKYIPSLVLQQWINKIDQPQISLPELQTTETVVLFADISGFTMISEACALMGVRGNEELAFCINRYMEGMVKSLGKYGGDIIKFVGDAMIVMWPRFSTDGAQASGGAGKQVIFKDQLDDRVTVVRKAIQCAIDIQNELNNKKIMSNVTNLSVKIGIGFGQCALLYVGGVFNRSEFFTVGDALTQALSSEENATAGGQIIVHANAWGIVKEYFTSEELTNDHGKKFYKISGLIQGIRTRADAVLLRNLIQTDNFAKIQNKLKSCIPAAIMPYLEIGYEQYGSETRRLTVMFASLGVDLSSAQTEQGMRKIQKIVTTVQQQVYRLEGSLNKLVMDDKGSTLICIWGLCPFAHEDDAARAILTAINMRRELAKIENTWCNVGISTGEVFSGVVGTSGSRKEFSVLGDYVNLAARIMYWPKKYKLTGKINVDLQTKKEADNYIKFNYKGHCEFKGKSVSLPIFEPVEPEEELAQCLKKVVTFDTFLKIHSNPFLVDRNSEHKKKQVRQVGRENLLHKVCDDLMDFFDQDADGREGQRPYILQIMGEIGSGKTLFARCIYDTLKKRKDFLRDDSMGSDFKPILISALNAESQMKFLNIWRPILQSMLFIHCKRNNLKPDKVIRRLIKSTSDEKFDIILDIFGMPDLKPEGKFKLPLSEDPIHFVKREKYPEDIVDAVLDFVIEFIKEVLGEKDEYYSDVDQSQISDYQQHNNIQSRGGQQNQYMFGEYPMVLILDTVFLMDEASWKLLELIKDECQQIAIILLMQTDTNNMAKIHPEAKTFYQETFGNHPELIKIIDLPPFKVDELNQLVTELASKYQTSMVEEIHLMTLIDDPAHSIKDPEICKIKEKELKKKHLVNENFQLINDEVLQITLQRCEGNPMNDYLTIKDQCLVPTQAFKKCKQRSDWTVVPVPGMNQKINSTLLDGFLKEMRSKMNKVDSENAVKGILLLKSAAVIGEVFSTKVLQHINPLRNESHKSIVSILKILEQKDFIEILDETDQKNLICRFRKCFLRETIYQFMLYRAQKKGLHQLTVQYIQNNPNSYDNDPEEEAEKLLNHILIAEDLDSEDKVPFKSKQGLVVKKFANKLLKNPNGVVKSGYLTKQGDKPNKKVEKRLMVIKAKEISWYHNDKELKAGKPLGVIYMSSVYHCVPANSLKSTDDLIIGTCAWRKKEIEKEGKREFIFGAKDEQERDEWISCIEYLRAKAIYDNFVQKFCNISFPLRRPDEDVQVDLREDFLNNLNDFGLKLKQQTRFNKVQGNGAQGGEEFSMMKSSPMQRNSIRGGRLTSKIGSFAAYNLQQVNESTYVNAINNPKDIAAKLKKLYNVSMVSFINQVSQNSSKSSHLRTDTLKKLPEVIKSSTSLALMDDSSFFAGHPTNHNSGGITNNSTILEGGGAGPYSSQFHQQQTNKSQKAQNNSNSMIQNSTLLQQHQNDSLMDESVRLKELRRISAIARRELYEDEADMMRSYLEEMKSQHSQEKKSGGAASGQKPSGQAKITEENESESQEEQDNEEESFENSSLPRKSGYSDLTAKSSSPNQGGIFFTSNSDASVAQQNQQKGVVNQQQQEVMKKKQSSNNVMGKPPIDNKNQLKQSRISQQLEMITGLQKQRELTFHKQQEEHDQDQQQQQQQQIFALNISPTTVTHDKKTPQKQSSSKLQQQQQQFEKIEEKVEFRTNKKKQSTKKQQKYQESSSSSEEEEEEEESGEEEEDDDEEEDEEEESQSETTNRDTGNFSQSDKKKQQQQVATKQQANNKKSQQKIPQEAIKRQDSINNQQKIIAMNSQQVTQHQEQLLQKQNSKDQTDLSTSADIHHKSSGSQSTLLNTQPTSQLQNISEIISQTIQEQVTKNFQQLFQTVQKMTNIQQQQQSSSPPGLNTTQRESSHSKSFTSSIYDEEWRQQYSHKPQNIGGAASSKKISMQKAQSKEQSVRPSLMKNPYNSNREKHQKEETEVDDEDDYIQESQIDQDIQLRQQQQKSLKSQNPSAYNTHQRQSLSKNKMRNQEIRDYSDSRDDRGMRNEPKINQIQRTQSPYQHQNMQGNYNNQSQIQHAYSPSPIHYRNGQDFSPLNQSQLNMYPGMYMSNPQLYPLHAQQSLPQFPPNYYDPSGYYGYPTPQPNSFPRSLDNDLFFLDDQFDNIPTTYSQNQPPNYISDISSIIGGETSEPQHQFAIVIEDVQCQLKGELMQLYEGDKVEVLRILNEVGMIECKYNNQVGVFPLNTIKMIKRAATQQQVMQTQQQQQQQFNKQASQRESKKKVSQFNDGNQIRQEKKEEMSQIFNQRQNFFKQGQEIIQNNSSSNNSTQSKQGQLKLQERKKQRQRKQMAEGNDSTERYIEQLNM